MLSGFLKWHVRLQLSQLLALHKTPTTEAGTNTGRSLLLSHCLAETSHATSVVGEISSGTSVPNEVNYDASVPSETSHANEEISHGTSVAEVSLATSVPGDVSIRTEISTQASGSINLDLCSFGKTQSYY